MVKKLLALFLVVLMSIESIGAVVSDNDGPAFVTKAEFEALKKSFDEQIDNYNKSIDTKIDGAIAAYLAGITTPRQTFSPFLTIEDGKNKIKGVAYDYNAIKKQLWNSGDCLWTFLGDGGNIPQSFIPFINAGGDYGYWTYGDEVLKNVVDYMPGFEFDEKGNITKIWGNDGLHLNLVALWGGDNARGRIAASTSPVLCAGFLQNNWDSINKLDTIYTNMLSTPDIRYSAQLALSNFNASYIKNNLSHVLVDVANNYSYDNTPGNKSGFWACWPNLRNVFRLYNSQVLVTKNQSDALDGNYIYNKCDAMIYAHPETASKLETFIDPITSDYDITKDGREYQFLLYQGAYNTYHSTLKIRGYRADPGATLSTHREVHYGIFVKKLKLKNDTTNDDLKPILGSETTKKFNNLNQFRNGKLVTYVDVTGKQIYPKFYGGIPLFNRQTKCDVTFNLKINNTTSGVNKIRVWIKKNEFPNGYFGDSTVWNAVDSASSKKHIDELVVYTTNEHPNNTNNYIDLDAGKSYTINLSNVDRNIPYFLRFAEVNTSGNCLNSGGEVVELRSFVEIPN